MSYPEKTTTTNKLSALIRKKDDISFPMYCITVKPNF